MSERPILFSLFCALALQVERRYQRLLTGHRLEGVADGFVCNGNCSGWVYSVAWSPDGKLLSSGSRDKTVRVWSAEDGSCAKVLSGHRYATNAIPCMYQP